MFFNFISLFFNFISLILTLFHWFVSGYDCAFQRKLRIQIKIEDFISQIMKTRENWTFGFYFHSHSLVKITTSGSIHPCFQNQWNKVFSIFIWIYSYSLKFLLYFIDFRQNQWNKVVLYFTVCQLYFIVFQLYFIAFQLYFTDFNFILLIFV